MARIERNPQRNYSNKGSYISYPLPHDEEERQRLALQHNLLLRTYDHKALHAPVKLTDEDWVLDIGTGTGIWLQELARQTPATPRYIGADVANEMFPDPSTLSANIKFEVHSVINLPAEWTNKFTVVHQRLLLSGLREYEWPKAIAEIYRVLKPGGWVQLFELELWVSGPALAQHLDMVYRLSDIQEKMWRNITKQLPVFLKQGGFINLCQDSRKTPIGAWAGQDGVDGGENILSTMRGFKTSLLNEGIFGLSETEYDELVDKASEEFDSTLGSESTWVMFWAQKAQ